MKTTARGIFLSVFFSFFLLFFTGNALAADTYNDAKIENSNVTSTNPLNTEADVPQNVHTTMQILIIETLSAVNCQLTGIDPASKDHRCLGYNPESGKIGYLPENGGVIGVMGNLISMTFTPPISTNQYVAYLDKNFGIQKSAYASDPEADVMQKRDDEGFQNPCKNTSRGIGFCSLAPVLSIWIAMRNIVYLILILIFVVIGLGIMLRIHIDPRTVMTIQNQIPKIIIGIILISFSFAIAGILIDTMWVATYLFAAVLGNATGLSTNTTVEILRASNPFNAASMMGGGIADISSKSAMAFNEIVKTAFTNIFNFDGLMFPLDVILDGIFSVFISSLAFIIIAGAIIISLLRLFISLIMAYINIILDVVFAPFWLMAGILPGGSVGSWFKDLLANLAVFPVAISFLILGSYFVNAFGQDNSRSASMAPPLTGGIDNGSIAAMIGLGFIMMLPGLLNQVKAAFKAPKLNFGPIMGPVGAAAGMVTNTVKGTGQTYMAGKEWHIDDYNPGTGQVKYGQRGSFKSILRKGIGG